MFSYKIILNLNQSQTADSTQKRKQELN